VAAGSGRPLRLLFFVDRTGTLRPYVPVISSLVERGHEVHLALARLPRGHDRKAVERLVRESRGMTYSRAAQRAPRDGWRAVAWVVRGLADLARYSHPRYEDAPGLRRRMTKKVLGRLERSTDLGPVGRRAALRVARRLAATVDAELSARMIRLAARLENAVPTSKRIDRFIREQAPDAVLVSELHKPASEQVEYVKSARALGIPVGILVASWDNLTNKGLLKSVPDRVFVWNEVQRREAVELHGIPAERVVATGAQPFDQWFELRAGSAREEFVRTAGLDPDEPYVLYLCSSPFVTDHARDEVPFVHRWIDALRASDDEQLRRVGVMVRPHPIGKQWREVDLRHFGNAVVWPAKAARPVEREERAEFFDSITHSAAVVGINTTAMIEAAILGKSVLTVLAPEFAQESTLHFHYLLEENGGFLNVASSLEEHVAQLGRVLADDDAGAQRRRRFIESFVRPHGLDRPATPILAHAIEELARLPVAARAPDAGLVLRVALASEAAFSALKLTARDFSGPHARRLRSRIGGKSRRHRLLTRRARAVPESGAEGTGALGGPL
jgi:hypothetical protein